MDRAELADFLRARREALTPADVGLPDGNRRRTPGLRREEVAQLAHMSADFYARLEQARGSRPSAETVAALSTALRMTPFERNHLYRLAGHTPPPNAFRVDHASPGLLRVLAVIDAPAQIFSDLGVTLKQNRMAQLLIGDQTGHTGLRRSIVYRWFTDPEQRALHPEDEHDLHAAGYVGILRGAHARNPEDAEANALIEALLEESAWFTELWTSHEMTSRQGTIKRFIHPQIGTVTVDCQIFNSQNESEWLIILTPLPGSEDVEKLKLLDVIGAQTF
jgi:transcriptional regulator with XRE-family HTH domain